MSKVTPRERKEELLFCLNNAIRSIEKSPHVIDYSFHRILNELYFAYVWKAC